MFFYYFLFMTLVCIACGMLTKMDSNGGLPWNPKQGVIWLLYLASGAVLLAVQYDMVKGILTSILFAYLAMAAYSDSITRNVYRFFQYPAFAAGIGYALLLPAQWDRRISFAIYVFLLLLIFRRYFGWADILAFIITGFFFLDKVQSILLCGLFHMLLALLLLAFVKYKNIDWKQGKFQEPCAFMPYVAVSTMCIVGYWIL